MASITVMIMNQIIKQFLKYTTKLERNETLTEYSRVLMIKISFFLFLNTGVFLVAGNIIANQSDFSFEGDLSYEVTLVMTMNAITPNLQVLVLKTFNLIGRIKIWMIKK